MKRREFIMGLGGALALPCAARAQPTPTIGLLGPTTALGWSGLTAAFHKGLGEVGYTEGRNVAFEYRWAGGQYERLAQMADDLVRHSVSVLVAFTTLLRLPHKLPRQQFRLYSPQSAIRCRPAWSRV